MDEIEILKATYWDEVTILRNQKEKDEFGITQNKKIVICENEPCAVSQKGGIVASGEIASIIDTHELFLDPNIPIIGGDTLNIRFENGLEAVYIASEPFFYPSHSITPITRKERL